MRKLGIYFVITILVVSLFPINPSTGYAEESEHKDSLSSLNYFSDMNLFDEDVEYKEENVILFAETSEEEINFYKDIPTQNEEADINIPDETEAILFVSEEELEADNADEEYAVIQYVFIDEEENNEEITMEGYVHIDHIVLVDEAEKYKIERDEEEAIEDEVNEEDSSVEDNDTNSEKDEDENQNSDESDEADKEDSSTEDSNDNEEDDSSDVVDSDNNESTGEENKSDKIDDKEQQNSKKKELNSDDQRTVQSSSSSSFENGDRHKDIVQIKKNMTKIGFGGMNINDLYGSYTAKRVKDFQKYFGLKETGVANQETQDKINSVANSPYQNGKRHKNTIQLKRDLNKIGFGGMNVNDLYGSFTAQRVSEFQKEYGLVINGIADEITRAKITEIANQPFDIGTRHKDVIQLKKNLTKVGFGGMNINDLYGSYTAKRVKDFQRYFGLKVTGVADQDTQDKIDSEANSPYQEGKRHKNTIQLKKDLNKIGFGGMNINDLYGSFTAQRVSEFQKEYGLVVNGIADDVTRAKVTEIANAPFDIGTRHKDVIQLKRNLTKVGFGGMNINDLYGSYTAKRVKDFQKYFGLKETGVADQDTQDKINSEANSPYQEGKRHKNTIQLKKDLNKIGFGGMNINDLYGSFTAQRVSEFQKEYGLVVNGIADEVTKTKITDVSSSIFEDGDRSEKVIQIKKELTKVGFGGMNINDLYGSYTAKRVKDFQKYFGLKPTGIADEETQDKINSIANSPYQEGKRHKNTIQLKEDLNKIGFGGMNINDLYGSFTAQRISEFQKEYGLVVNGIADDVTRAKITEVVKSGVGSTKTEYTDYNLSLNEALDIQMDRPTIITDKYKSDPAYVSDKYLKLNSSGKQGTVTGTVNVRAGTGTSYHIFGKLKKGDKVKVISKGNNWHEIEYSVWRNPKRSDMKTYLDPNKNDKFQHLRLDSSVGVSAAQLNKVLSGKGILEGQGQAFINGTKKHGVNEAYLIAHALLETGHGTSTLAKGVEVGKDKNGKLVRVTSSNRKNLTAIKTTYNMFGIGAVDSNPLNGGAITAYENGWFSPAAAIEGGAKWIGDGYIYNEHRQNTLYKMKWNPRMSEGYAWKQYATDIAWATKQVTQIKNIYNQLDNPSYHYDIARYK